MRAYFSSLDSKHLYPLNTKTNFRVQLPQPIEGTWSCGVIQCILPSKPSAPIYILCDFVESTVLCGQNQPLLCMTNTRVKEFLHIHYIPVKTRQLGTVHIQLVNREGVEADIQDGETIVVLAFQNAVCKPVGITF